jgi:hypothetical protein
LRIDSARGAGGTRRSSSCQFSSAFGAGNPARSWWLARTFRGACFARKMMSWADGQMSGAIVSGGWSGRDESKETFPVSAPPSPSHRRPSPRPASTSISQTTAHNRTARHFSSPLTFHLSHRYNFYAYPDCIRYIRLPGVFVRVFPYFLIPGWIRSNRRAKSRKASVVAIHQSGAE